MSLLDVGNYGPAQLPVLLLLSVTLSYFFLLMERVPPSICWNLLNTRRRWKDLDPHQEGTKKDILVFGQILEVGWTEIFSAPPHWLFHAFLYVCYLWCALSVLNFLSLFPSLYVPKTCICLFLIVIRCFFVVLFPCKTSSFVKCSVNGILYILLTYFLFDSPEEHLYNFYFQFFVTENYIYQLCLFYYNSLLVCWYFRCWYH